MVHQPPPELDQVFHALADPTRRSLLAALTSGEATVSELAAPYAMSLTAVSKHLRVLEEAHLITRHRHGREFRCRLVAQPLAEAWSWIDRYRVFWDQRLDRLEAYLEEKQAVEHTTGQTMKEKEES